MAGLPEGCENIDSLLMWLRNFFDVVSKLQQPPEQLLEEMKPSPSFIIADSQRARAHKKKGSIITDKNLAWTCDIAPKLDMPRL